MQEGLFLWTTEGADYKVWLGDENANKFMTVRRNTAELLSSEGIIEGINDDLTDRKGIFKHVLTKKGDAVCLNG